MNGGGVGAHRQLTPGLRWAQFWKQIQTLKECLCCHIYCVDLGTPWYQIVGDSRTVSTGSPSTLDPRGFFSGCSVLSSTYYRKESGIGQIAR